MAPHVTHGVLAEHGFFSILQRIQDPIFRIFLTSLFRSSEKAARILGFSANASGGDSDWRSFARVSGLIAIGRGKVAVICCSSAVASRPSSQASFTAMPVGSRFGVGPIIIVGALRRPSKRRPLSCMAVEDLVIMLCARVALADAAIEVKVAICE